MEVVRKTRAGVRSQIANIAPGVVFRCYNSDIYYIKIDEYAYYVRLEDGIRIECINPKDAVWVICNAVCTVSDKE